MAIWGNQQKWDHQVSVGSSALIPLVMNPALNKVIGTSLPTGPKGSTDYSSAVVSAVKKFQKQAGLTVDGDCGPNTCRALVASGAAMQVTPDIARAAIYEGLRIYNEAIVSYVFTQDERLGEAARQWGRWLWAARQKGRQKIIESKDPQKPKLANYTLNDAPTQWTKAGVKGSVVVDRGGVETIGFAPALALPLIGGAAAEAFAAEVVIGVGYVASAAAAAWAAVTIGEIAADVQSKTADKEVTIKDVIGPVEHDYSKEKDKSKTTSDYPPAPPGRFGWNVSGNPKGWLGYLGALCAGLGALLISLLGVVASLAPIVGAAIGMGIEVLIAAAGLLLLFLAKKKRKRGG